MAACLDKANQTFLDQNKSPSRKVNELDNRASNFYIGLYWAELMAMHDPDFQELATVLKDNRQKIVAEFKSCQGKPQDVGGYYKFDKAKVRVLLG